MYTRYFNKKYNYIGHLWQDKYHAEIIKDDKQMLETSRYIHLNPVRANIVKNPEEYRWSSLPIYIGLKQEVIVNSERILWYFQGDNPRQQYKAFLERALLAPPR